MTCDRLILLSNSGVCLYTRLLNLRFILLNSVFVLVDGDIIFWCVYLIICLWLIVIYSGLLRYILVYTGRFRFFVVAAGILWCMYTRLLMSQHHRIITSREFLVVMGSPE